MLPGSFVTCSDFVLSFASGSYHSLSKRGEERLLKFVHIMKRGEVRVSGWFREGYLMPGFGSTRAKTKNILKIVLRIICEAGLCADVHVELWSLLNITVLRKTGQRCTHEHVNRFQNFLSAWAWCMGSACISNMKNEAQKRDSFQK